MEGFAWGFSPGVSRELRPADLRRAARRSLLLPPARLLRPGLKEFVRLSIPDHARLLPRRGGRVDHAGLRLLSSPGDHLVNKRATPDAGAQWGILGQASGVASYPFLSALAAEGKKEEMSDNTLSLTLRVGLPRLRRVGRLVAVVLSRGGGPPRLPARSVHDRRHDAHRLRPLRLLPRGPFWCAQAVVSRGFFAMRDTWTPTLVGPGPGIVALPMYYLLQQSYGVFGLALASTVGILLYAAALSRDPDAADGGAGGSARPDRVREKAGVGRGAARRERSDTSLLGAASRVPRCEYLLSTGPMIRLARRGGAIGGAYFLTRVPVPQRDGQDIHRREEPAPPARVVTPVVKRPPPRAPCGEADRRDATECGDDPRLNRKIWVVEGGKGGRYPYAHSL